MPNPIQCAVCREYKRPGDDTNRAINHWWAVSVSSSGVFSCRSLPAKGIKTSEVAACGSAHTTTLFQRFLTTGALDKDVHPDTAPKLVGLTEQDLLQKKEEE